MRQNAALLAEQKSKSTFKTKMRFAEIFQSVSYATQLIWRLWRVSRYLSQILHVEVLLLRFTVRSKFATHTFIRETARITRAKPVSSLPFSYAFSYAFSTPSIHFPCMAVHAVLAKFVCSLESFSFWAREKKGVHFGAHRSRVSVHASHEALTRRSPSLTLANPTREVGVFKAAWCG